MEITIASTDDGVVIIDFPEQVSFNIPPERLQFIQGYVVFYYLGLIAVAIGRREEDGTIQLVAPSIHVPLGISEVATGPVMKQNFMAMVGKEFYDALTEALLEWRNTFEVSQAAIDTLILKIDDMASVR